MARAFQFSPTFLALQLVSIAIMIGAPIALAVACTRRFRLGWRYVGYGALVFFLSQMVLRVPLVAVVQATLAPLIEASAGLQWLFALALAVTAGLFESVGRYLGYRWLMGGEPKTWPKAVLYSIEHGGIESLLLVGGTAIAQLATLALLTEAQLATLPAPTTAALRATAASWNATPLWLSIGGGVERLAALAFHVAMSVVVLQVFTRGERRWLWYAVAAHAALDFVAPFVIPQLAPDPVVRGVTLHVFFALVLVGALALIRALRAPAAQGTPTRGDAGVVKPPLPWKPIGSGADALQRVAWTVARASNWGLAERAPASCS